MRILFLLVLFLAQMFSDTPIVLSEGSQVDDMQIKVKVVLIKEDNSTVTLLDDNESITVKADSNTTALSDSIVQNLPSEGTYVAVEYTVKEIKTKAKIVVDGTTYYTRSKTVHSPETWDLTTDPSQYGYTTMAPSFVDKNRASFTKPLVIADASATLYIVNKFDKQVVATFSDSNPSHAHWIGESQLFTGILPAEPKKEVVFDINYTGSGLTPRGNTITMLTDANGSMLGAHMFRPQNAALEGSFFKDGDQNTTTHEYSIYIHHANSTTGWYYHIDAKIDCEHSSYSDLSIAIFQSGEAHPPFPSSTGYTLTTSGTATCKDISY